ncbi:hypothetical protein PHYBLDRAFT_169027 [Phycomyces blakesleeanus NRRL 1555(-)]|uniref:Uncharacterized protein n=1 Tax=Phycomyces blakesleeanus (strain ATCC 8743b / DSM 1359 / FGSC 10004 / NBRC 33097 / NRRL 1555) TaxID=763407 RepID=A0A167MG91_PHYB8|nr:hypothetical protein PHYBLDRAFT_169027 [Phycomyces blakesleeanus NRRL 1555(-)]OAD72766.1 hypothetical protein PHYBLDRAFT_169027 [Phycomyces blakesleeanus NRRL 1555(-)]|eukprot:XP_018290806.1 hypothetical protein PHYBLDRAFT_169027 [Phycomyces blakesleeanus NRRL 1555(-)]
MYGQKTYPYKFPYSSETGTKSILHVECIIAKRDTLILYFIRATLRMSELSDAERLCYLSILRHLIIKERTKEKVDIQYKEISFLNSLPPGRMLRNICKLKNSCQLLSIV